MTQYWLTTVTALATTVCPEHFQTSKGITG